MRGACAEAEDAHVSAANRSRPLPAGGFFWRRFCVGNTMHGATTAGTRGGNGKKGALNERCPAHAAIGRRGQGCGSAQRGGSAEPRAAGSRGGSAGDTRYETREPPMRNTKANQSRKKTLFVPNFVHSAHFCTVGGRFLASLRDSARPACLPGSNACVQSRAVRGFVQRATKNPSVPWISGRKVAM